MIRLWQLKSFHRLTQWPFSSLTKRLFSWQWAEAVVDFRRRSGIGGEWQEGRESYHVRCKKDQCWVWSCAHTIAPLSLWFHLKLIPFIYLMQMQLNTVGRAKHTSWFFYFPQSTHTRSRLTHKDTLALFFICNSMLDSSWLWQGDTPPLNSLSCVWICVSLCVCRYL